MFEYRYKPPFYLRRWFQVLVVLSLVGVIAGAIAIYVVLDPFRQRADSFDFADINNLAKASIIYDRNGVEIERIFDLENRDPVELEKVPYHMQQALVAIEDARYYQHDGVDYMGIVRAVFRNLKAGRQQQGASTITQQLARNAYGMTERSYERKLVEAFLAHRIEQNFSKGQIMEMYFNRIYFGSGFWGVNSASKGYFGKEIQDITVEEAATLCGLIKSPNRLSPFNNPDGSKKARDYVFERMVAEKMLTRTEANELRAKPIKTVTRRQERKNSFKYPYEYIRQQVVELIGYDNASKGGFEIHTTLDSKLQSAAQNSLSSSLAKIEKRDDVKGQTYAEFEKVFEKWKSNMSQDEAATQLGRPLPKYLQGALLAIDTKTGAIRALVGGRDFDHSAFDRTTLARRKTGTAFTPFVYATGFAQGKFPGSKVNDFPIDAKYVQIGALRGILGEWGVEGKYTRENWITARSALVRGKNAATVRFGIDIGVDPVVSLAKDAGMTFDGELQKYNASFLGHSEVSMAEATLAYTIFANAGRRPKEIFVIDTIRDRDGTKIFESENVDASVNVLDPYAAYQVHSALTDVMTEGTGVKARAEYGLGDFPVAGKTGTSYGSEDNWFIGYTDKVTLAVWAGFDKSREEIYPNAYSNDTVLPTWVEMMNLANESFPAEPIPAPVTAHPIEVCKISGNRATEFCYHTDEVDGTQSRVHETYIEFLNPKYSINRRCAVHSVGGKVNLAYNQPISSGRSGKTSGWRAKPIYSLNVPAVFMQSHTVLGDDPYNSRQPIVRPRIIKTPEPAEGEEVAGEPGEPGEVEPSGDRPLVPVPLQGQPVVPTPITGPNSQSNPGIFRNPNAIPGYQPPAQSQGTTPGNPNLAQPPQGGSEIQGGSIFRSQNPRPVEGQPQASTPTQNSAGSALASPYPYAIPSQDGPAATTTTIPPRALRVEPEVTEARPPRPVSPDGVPSILDEIPGQETLEPPRAIRVEFD